MEQGSVRLASASSALGFTALMLTGFVYMAGSYHKKAQAPSVLSFAVPLGSEQGEQERPAEPDHASAPQPAEAAETPPPEPQLPLPALVPAMVVPVPVSPATPPAVAASARLASTVETAPKQEAALQAVASPAAQPATRKGARDGLESSAPTGNSRNYAARIRSWLYAHKTYPKRSRMRHEEGVVRVSFVLDRQGRLLEGRVVAGSKFAALDEEAEAMLRRASPYPAAPRDVLGERIEFAVPIEFILPG